MTLSKGGRAMLYAQAADLIVGDPPSGPPTNVAWEYYSGTKILYSWTNAGQYTTEYSYDSGTTVKGSFGPGVSQFESGSTTLQELFAVRHINGPNQSSWAVLAPS